MAISDSISVISGASLVTVTVYPTSSGATTLTIDDATFALMTATKELTSAINSMRSIIK